MPRTQIASEQIDDGTIVRDDINTTTSGKALITKVIAGNNIDISSTGVNDGTGDVTVNGYKYITLVLSRTGNVAGSNALNYLNQGAVATDNVPIVFPYSGTLIAATYHSQNAVNNAAVVSLYNTTAGSGTTLFTPNNTVYLNSTGLNVPVVAGNKYQLRMTVSAFALLGHAYGGIVVTLLIRTN